MSVAELPYPPHRLKGILDLLIGSALLLLAFLITH
jgi:hypothetical protein